MAEDENDDLPAPGKVWEGPKVSLGALMAQHVAATKQEKPNVEPVRSGELADRWNAMKAMLGPGAERAFAAWGTGGH